MFCKHKIVGSSPIRSINLEHGVNGNVSALGVGVMGSNPIVLNLFCIAQSAEQRAFNSEVLGSIPSARI